MNARAATRLLAYGLVLASISTSFGCHRAANGAAGLDASPLAPITVRDDTPGLLLTWIDDKGDFHVEQKPSDVPLVGRDAVRVVDPSREDGARGDTVYVADLRVASADGAFPVHTMTREDFDALAVTRREKGGATLAAAAPSDAGAPNEPSPSRDSPVAGRPAVIVYGASWCSACHQAEAYLKKRGIVYIEKDIEQDGQAAAEMQSKLKRAGLRGGSIPVIDVRGHIMIGFDPGSIEDALGRPI